MRLPRFAALLLLPACLEAAPSADPVLTAVQISTQTSRQTPGSSLAHAAGRALEGKQYKEAVDLAARALKAEPGNLEALTVLHFAEGRAAASAETPAPGKTAAPNAQAGPSPGADLPGAQLPRSFRRKAAPPPSAPKPKPLDPKAPDYWDRQLLAPLLTHSDANPVAREYLSPLLKANKVTLRLERVKTNPELNGVWGFFNLETSIIHYNLDAINDDIRQYDAFYAKTAPSRAVRPIRPTVPLDPAQIEYVTGRFLPLAVHEAGGHGTHASDLKQRLGSISAPINKDTEIMAWRLEAAAIELERRRDPRYLTEPTQWDSEENNWLRTWEDAHRQHASEEVVKFLDSMSTYQNFVLIGSDPETTRRRYAAAVGLVQSVCRRRYDPTCSAAITRLATLYPTEAQALFESARSYLDSHPDDAAGRAEVMTRLSQTAIVQDRLDPKGITVVSGYYKEQEERVQRLEGLAYPVTIWQKLRSLWHE